MNNTKSLVFFCLIIMVSGFGFLWLGFKPDPAPVVEKLEVATQSAILGILSTGQPASGWEGEKVLVTRVVDGDTIVVEGNLTVRFVGIDTPETVDPKRPVGCYGKQASNEVKSLLTGKEVILQKDVSDTDKYHRLLRYIYLPLDNGQTLFVNDYLVREGFARVLTYPPDVKYDEKFRNAESEAKMDKKGLWGKC